MSLRIAALTAALLFASSAANAGARDDLSAFTKGLKGLDGQFSQQVLDARGKQKERASGRVAVSAPRLFRWEYTKPYPQLIVADGKTVWVYEPDLQQASKRAQGVEEANSPLAILLDPSKLDRDFVVKVVQRPRQFPYGGLDASEADGHGHVDKGDLHWSPRPRSWVSDSSSISNCSTFSASLALPLR